VHVGGVGPMGVPLTPQLQQQEQVWDGKIARGDNESERDRINWGVIVKGVQSYHTGMETGRVMKSTYDNG